MQAKLVLSSLMTVMITVPLNLEARGFSLPHDFQAGDILSADMMNDVLSKLGSTYDLITEDDLVGDWECSSYMPGDLSGWSNIQSGWQLDADNVYSILQPSFLTFTNEGDTYVIKSTTPNPFFSASAEATDSNYKVLSNVLMFMLYPSITGISTFELTRLSDSKITMTPLTSLVLPIVLCDRLNLPPINPKQLSASLSNATVSLSWTDDSDDEDSFKILRRDSLTGEYAELGTASADATTYTDTLTAEGKYWYRVVAVNENGDSVGSNVVKVTYGDDTESLRNELRMLRERMDVIESELGQ